MRSPFRDDKNESFSVFQRDGKWFFKDHAVEEHHGDEITLIELARSISNREAIKIYHELARVPWEREGGGGGFSAKKGSQSARKSDPAKAASKPGKRSDYKPDWSNLGQLVTIYEYLDQNGEVLHQTLRFDPKNFRQRRRPNPNETPADDGWVYFLEGIEPVLYRLPEIAAADESEPIFFVEGEKDAETLRTLGLLSTTVPMGAGKWRETYGRWLKGKWVVVIGDNDDAGRKHVYKVCQELSGLCSRLGAVHLAEKWAECQDKFDVSDWLDYFRVEPAGLGLGDSCADDDVKREAGKRMRTWADDARAPEAIRYSHCFSYGDRGAVKVHQDELAGILVEERGVKFAGEVWWAFEKTKWRQLEVQREPRRWIMDAVRSHADARREMSSYMVNSVEELMANRCAMHVDTFNSHDPDLVNVSNGMLNMRDFTLRPHDPKDLSTVQVPHRFDPKARCLKFQEWLKEMLPAEDVQLQVQEIFGYCLAPKLNYHKFFFFYGDGGTGKSTCIDVLSLLIGKENGIAVRLQDLDNAFVRAQLVGKRLYLATELNRDSFRHIDLIKAIVSGDPIHVEKKHKDGYTYRPQGRFIMASNVRAQTSDTTDGFFRRLCQITFENKIPDDQKDYTLLEKFNSEMDGVLFWALEGLQRLMARGRFEATQDSQKAADLIMMHRASAKSFFDKCIEECEDPNALVLCTERLYEEYNRWCQWEHVKPHFESHEYLSRELLNKIPSLRERRKRADMAWNGNKARRMCYAGLRFKNWEPEGMNVIP